MRLNELRILSVFLGKAEGKLGDYGSGDGESNEERPVPFPFAPEENGPWIELSHFVPLFINAAVNAMLFSQACFCCFVIVVAATEWEI